MTIDLFWTSDGRLKIASDYQSGEIDRETAVSQLSELVGVEYAEKRISQIDTMMRGIDERRPSKAV